MRGRAAAGTSCTGAVGSGGAPFEDTKPEPLPDPALAGVTHQFYRITVVDGADGTPIAGATLTTIGDVVYTSDKHGRVAFYEPGLMGRKVFFFAARDGYQYPADGFGYHGVALQIEEGGSGKVALQRVLTPPPAISVGDLDSRLLDGPVPGPESCFGIRVIDQVGKRGVPLVTLTRDGAAFVSDSQGFVADCDPDVIGHAVTYEITSHGYQFAPGSLELSATAGTISELELTRINLAERLYRSTGQGVYRDSVLLGLTAPIAEPLLNGGVVGQDSALAAVLNGRLFWTWGTTYSPAYPLAVFGAVGASSELPGQGGLEPWLGLNQSYLLDKQGNALALSPGIEPASQPTWLSTLVVVPDAQGNEQAFANFVKPNKDLSTNRQGLLHYDAASTTYLDTGVSYPLTDYVAPDGQPTVFGHGDQRYAYYASPLRIPASAEAMLDPSSYETFSALPAGGKKALEYEADGTLSYGFKQGALLTTLAVVRAAGLGEEQSLDGHLADVTSGVPFKTSSSVAQSFSDHRQRFLRLYEQVSGTTSNLGELWYAEADTPMGPWVYARKVVTHDKATFSSPWLHPYFEQAEGRFVFFEGTLSSIFAGDAVVNVPRYNHNQLVYRLDLDDPRVSMPVAIYDTSDGARRTFAHKEGLASESPPLAAAFFAPDRPGSDTVPVSWSAPACAPRQLTTAIQTASPPLFYAVAADDPARAANLVALYEFANDAGEHAYDTNPDATFAGFTRSPAPLAYVWPSPIAVKLPVSEYLGDLQADAGPDQCLAEVARDRGADITLDGSDSSSATNAALHYAWTEYGQDCVIGSSASLSVHLRRGVHAFRIAVSDDAGHQSSDDVLIQISASP